MKKALLVLTTLLSSIAALAQQQPTAPPQGNINGVLWASGYNGWAVPQGNLSPFSWSSPVPCTANSGGTSFPAFTTGSPIYIVDQITPSTNEAVTVTSVQITAETCTITTTTPVYNHTQFSLRSNSAGLQEAINANLGTQQPLTVMLTADWFRQGGTISEVTGYVTGNSLIGIVDLTKTPTTWYAWNSGTGHYVQQIITGSAGELNTLQGDLVTNNQANSAAVDAYQFVAGATIAGSGLLTPQQAYTAAAANNGTFVIQPNVARTPFTSAGNNRAIDLRPDVPATAVGITEHGAVCDVRNIYGTFSASSTEFTVTNGTLTSADIGRTLVAVGVVGSTPTRFESVVASIIDSAHGNTTTAFPFTQSVGHQMDLAHDDTAAITNTLSLVGANGTLVVPAAGETYAGCLTHTLTLKGQSPIGLGPQSALVGFPGEDILALPDPSVGPIVNGQGSSHIHDLTFLVDARIDATHPWQVINDSGTTAKPAMYRPIATQSGVTNDPVAPGWLIAGFNGAASISASSPVMCVPSTETAPAVGQVVVFPYLASVFTATVSSTAGSCAGGASPRTLSASLPSGSTNAQAEWFAGSSVQNLNTSIGSGSCPATITLSNSINPAPGFEANVAPYGLIQIDGEQFTYFGKSVAGNPSPANTLYGVQCAQNGTTRAAHASSATVVPLNPFQPTYPWPVTPTLNSNDTTPSGTAGFFPGWNVGNSGIAAPVATGISQSYAVGAFSSNAKIENLSFANWPSDGSTNWLEVNHTAMIYWAQPSYATTFQNLFAFGTFYGLVGGGPSIENGNWARQQPTQDGTHYDGFTIFAAVPVVVPYGNQNTYANFNVYSNEGTNSGFLGANTCFYFNALYNDQTGSITQANSLGHFKNMYCEPESGAHAGVMPNWEWDGYNETIEDQHMGGGGEVYIGGGNQHWIGGNFNNSATSPVTNWGVQNTSDYSTNLGHEPKGNVYGTNSLINFGWGSKFMGTTASVYGSATGPYGAMQVGNSREPIRAQTNETFNTGNLTAPYPSSEGGFITPEEFNANFNFEAQAMTVGWTYDATSPITNSYTACNVGNTVGAIYCATGQFNQDALPIGPGQRLVPGKYTLYISMKDKTQATNTAKVNVFSNCNSFSQTYTFPITNAWPSSAAGFFSTTIDFSALAGSSNCSLGLRFYGMPTADLAQVGFFDFAPLAENLQAQTITATTINGPTNGASTNGCQQSPVTGIQNGYECPTVGWSESLTGNQLSTDTTITITSTTGLPPAGCFFVDSEYECYTTVVDSTHLGGILRGQYTTTAAAHTAGTFPGVISVNLLLGSPLGAPKTGLFGYSGEPPVLGVNNPTPQNHNGGGAVSVLSINNGGNETYFDSAGAFHMMNGSATSTHLGNLNIGQTPNSPNITDSGLLWQDTVPATAYDPMTLGGGHAGTLNVIQTPTITAPIVTTTLGAGSSTLSYVCSGTDFDGNLINGTTTTLTNAQASWAYPNGYQVQCPYVAGVNTYQIYRTAGGPTQGLMASGTGPAFIFRDYGSAGGGGTPPGSNGSNPKITVAGTGTPCIAIGNATICSGTGAPTSTCGTAPNGIGSLWMRTDGTTASTALYSCGVISSVNTWSAVTVP